MCVYVYTYIHIYIQGFRFLILRGGIPRSVGNLPNLKVSG